jgi:hypothetical protein
MHELRCDIRSPRRLIAAFWLSRGYLRMVRLEPWMPALLTRTRLADRFSALNHAGPS